MTKSINDPDDVYVETYVCLVTVWGGETIAVDEADAIRYRRDPDLFAAHHFGITKSEYREWIQTHGSPLCSELTKSGRPCLNITKGFQLKPSRWKELDRNCACSVHGGERR